MRVDNCPCDTCENIDFCDSWDMRFCCTYCHWIYGECEPPCEDCNPMDI